MAGSVSATTLSYMAVAGAAVSAVGTVASGMAAKEQGNTQAELYRRQAAREEQIGMLNSKREEKKNKQIQASQRALLGAKGVDMTEGSALLVQSELAEEGKLNEMLIKNNAEAAADTARSQGVIAKMQGKNAQTASYFRAGSTLLQAGKVAFG